MKMLALIRVILGGALVTTALPSSLSRALAAEPPMASRWVIAESGGVAWDVRSGDVHEDFMEMNGEQVALVVRYGIDAQGQFTVNHDVVWPMLRWQPNLTENHLRKSFGEDAGGRLDDLYHPEAVRFRPESIPALRVRVGDEWRPLDVRTLQRVHLFGVVSLEGTLGIDGSGGPKLAFRRETFPSQDKPVAIDTTKIINTTSADIELSVDEFEQYARSPAELGVYGSYRVSERVVGAGVHALHPGQSTDVTVVYEAHKNAEPEVDVDIGAERRSRIRSMDRTLEEMQLETPDPILNTEFQFAKFHSIESIYRTKVGLLQSPGGGVLYYAAIWANDQAEYSNPFFGMLGDPVASEAAINSFRQFARYMNSEYRAIPSSIISEGAGFWNGAGDRGDMAMIAYGAARFGLANGDKQAAEELWPLIEWCLEYEKRMVTAQGVVASDSDEMEGRFPAGKANLHTSSLYYDALRSAEMLGRALAKNKQQRHDYALRAEAARSAIDRYFGADVAGFKTYRYYNKADLLGDPSPEKAAYATKPDVLRAWIAVPLTVDIFDRKTGTTDALFSPKLWTQGGLATESGQEIYWDRATLYALRGVFAAGATERALEHLKAYSASRLLGDHVPYPFEAYPEGGKSQLAAESALYCRIFTEGLFGIRPTGLRSFMMTPRLPANWPSMALKHVHAFGNVFDLSVGREGDSKLRVTIIRADHPQQIYVSGPDEAVNIQL